MADGETVIIINVGTSQTEIDAAGVREIFNAHPTKGAITGNIHEIYASLTALIRRNDTRIAAAAGSAQPRISRGY